MKPQRIRLSRKKGFDLQAVSLALNGLPAVSCARPSCWGNPFVVKRFGRNLVMELFKRTMHGIWTPSGLPKSLISEAYDLRTKFLKRHSNIPLEHARFELRDHNLACWCSLLEPCHVDILLELANV